MKLKILHIYRTYFPDPPGGLQEAIRQICLATAPFGCESRIFTLSPQPAPSVIERPEGKVIRSRSWAAPASCDIGGIQAFRRFRELSCWADVIHYHFPWPFADLLRFVTDSSKPSILTYHSDVVRQRSLARLYAPLMRRTLGAMAAVVATSPAYARTSPVLNSMVRPEQLRVIPLGMNDSLTVNNQFFDESAYLQGLGLDTTIPFLLAIGVLRYYKGFHVLIEAARQIKGIIVVAGSGPEEGNLKALAAQYGLTNVVFAGQISVNEKRVLLQRCRMLALPSHLRSEAFGMVLVEAAMFAKPLVSCEIGTGTSYVNADKKTGFVVLPESPQALADPVNRLFDDQQLAESFGMAARKRYEELFSSESLGRQYSELYSSVAL